MAVLYALYQDICNKWSNLRAQIETPIEILKSNYIKYKAFD